MIEPCNYGGFHDSTVRYTYRIKTPTTNGEYLGDTIDDRRSWCYDNCSKSWYDRWYTDAFPITSTKRFNYFLFETIEDATHFFLVWGSYV